MSIADKLKTVAQKMEDVYRTGLFKYAPKLTASGETILLENSAPEPFVSMTAYGHSWQNETPTPTEPQPIESAKEVKVFGGNYFNINNFDESIQDNGVYRKDNGFAMQNYYNGSYTTLGALCPELKAGDEVYLNFEVVNAGSTSEFYLYGSGRDWILGNSLVITQADLDDGFSVYGIDGETTIYKNIVVSKEPIPFEPYKEPQTLTLQTLRGIGDVRDYVDYERKKLVRKIGVLSNPTFQLSSGYFVDNSELFSTDVTNSYNDYSPDDLSVILSNKLPFYKDGLASKNEIGAYQGYRRIYARIQGVSSEEEFNSLMQGSEFLYILAEPIETDLTDEEIYAFKRLRANSPNTTIVGQGQLDVTYIVDNRQ